MKHEVFVLGGQRIDQEGMEERLGEMRKERRERMRKGAIVSSSPQGMTSWSSSIKNWFFKLILKCHGVKQNATRRSIEHCTPHAYGAWLNELGWSQ